MIHFFRDVLDGPVYFIVFVVSIILIMAIIGFIMERLKLEKEEKDKRVVVAGTTPIEPVRTREVVLNTKENEEKQEPVNSSEVVVIPNMMDQELKREPMFTLDSSSVNVTGTEVETPSPKVKAEDVVTVIDFGSTNSVETNNQSNQN